MTFSTFQSILVLLMCDDPTNLQPPQREELEVWADEQARKFGFIDWIEAYHHHDGKRA